MELVNLCRSRRISDPAASQAAVGNTFQTFHTNSENNHQQEGKRSDWTKAALVSALGLAVGTGLLWKLSQDETFTKQCKKWQNLRLGLPGKVLAATIKPGALIDGLPTYSAADVAAHDNKEKGIWVIYGNGVYDITEYVIQHPGGTKILMAAGKSIEPFWEIYSVHKNDEIFEIMESYRIGNITEVPVKEKSSNADDPYKDEPERSPLLIPSSQKPFNAEPPVQMLVDQFLTPNDLFYVRNHLPVPVVNIDNFTLDLAFPTCTSSLNFQQLTKNFPKRSVTAAIQCAGNRRNEMVKIKPVKGLNWGSAAISNAKFSGVSLNELLNRYNINIDTVRAKYIVFEGLDTQPDGSPYGASIPLELARMLKNEIIIAYEMNGEPLSRDHGYPLRIIIPGVVGARQVKWLKKIYFSTEESTSHWQRRDYKGFNASVDWHNVDFDKSVSISQLPVISAICDPVEGQELEEGAEEVTVKGYAWSGGGRGIIRVDVSADGGKTWHEANLKPNGQTPYHSWAWTLWEADIPLPKAQRKTELIVKAIDVSYNVQPDSVAGIWNLRGCLSNAWHRVNVKIPSAGAA